MSEAHDEYTTTKYVVRAKFEVDGVVEKPDVVGAVFGQTEGLLGDELDLRELQKTGRIGRIVVNVNTQGGKSSGVIIIPSSIDKIETAILASSLETIDRVGPCTARFWVERIEDVRELKRRRITKRASEILREWEEKIAPESKEIAELVVDAIKSGEIGKYGSEELPAGPGIADSDTVIVVEGRADVQNLLRYGFKNVVAVEGTKVPQSIIELSRKKTVIAFLDGDRGGDLILKELLQVADVDYVTRAPVGKDVEELTRKEIVKALRNKVPAEQASVVPEKAQEKVKEPRSTDTKEKKERDPSSSDQVSKYVGSINGTLKAALLNNRFELLKETPVGELTDVIPSLEGVHAIVFDGVVTQRLVDLAHEKGVRFLIGARRGSITKLPVNMLIKTFSDFR